MSGLKALDRINAHDVILASRSTRRQHLLKELGIVFRIAEALETDERYPADLAPDGIPVYLARQKARLHRNLLRKESILITADTIVWSGDKVIPKPRDLDDARIMLRELSGKKHEVFTGVCLTSLSGEMFFCEGTSVYFRKLPEEEINYYVEGFRPLDKAGAYGIQEWIGLVGIERVEGSFYNVMGLPVQQLYLKLVDFTGK
jgi:septum formation protein